MSRTLGTVARGVRTPIFREGDNVVEGVVSSVLTALKENGIQPHDKDVAAVTESVVARCQGNYATVEQIAADVKAKTGGKTVGVTFPILSRNRFSLLLSGIAAGVEKVVLMLSYPSDEVGNHLVSLDQLDEAGIDPWHDVLDLEQFRAAFGKVIHPFTGVDYVDFYKGIIEEAGAQAEIVFANRVQTVLDYTDTVICCDIHTRQRSKRLLKKAGARVVLGLDDLLTAPVNGSGYNPQYGLLGSNKADDTRVKLFPRDADVVAEAIGQRLSEATGKRIEAMVYGDGAFKDPVGKIWELADPVVSPGYTAGLEGTPNELKLKYLADNDFASLSGDALTSAIKDQLSDCKYPDLVADKFDRTKLILAEDGTVSGLSEQLKAVKETYKELFTPPVSGKTPPNNGRITPQVTGDKARREQLEKLINDPKTRLADRIAARNELFSLNQAESEE